MAGSNHTRDLKKLIKHQNFKEATERFHPDDFNLTFRDHREALSMLAFAKAKIGAYSDAEKICSAVVSRVAGAEEVTSINAILLCIGESKQQKKIFSVSLQNLVDRFGNVEEISISLGKLFLFLGESDRAVSVLFKVVRPTSSVWYSLLIQSLEDQGYHFEVKQFAIECLDKNLMTTAIALIALKSLVIASTSKELHALLDRFLDVDSTDFYLLERLAWAFATIGERERSIRLLERSIAIGFKQGSDTGRHFYQLAILDPQRPFLKGITKTFVNRDVEASNKELAFRHFGRAELAMTESDMPRFFSELRCGNELLHGLKERLACIDRYKSELNLSRELVSKLDEAADLSVYEGPVVFIVGLPRCGSTLLAQYVERYYRALNLGELDSVRRIFGRWEKVLGDGEPVNVWGMLFSERWKSLVPVSSKSHNSLPLLIDKSLANFLHVDLISRMFPNSLIINLRRDFEEHVFGIYRRLFESSALAYTSAIDDIKTMKSLEASAVDDAARRLQRLRVFNFEMLVSQNFEEILESVDCLQGAERRQYPLHIEDTAPVVSTSKNQVRSEDFVNDFDPELIKKFLPQISE